MTDGQATNNYEEQDPDIMVLPYLREVMKTTDGREFIKYLLKTFDVTGLPEMGVEGNILFDHMGFLRAGRAIFNVVTQADAKAVGEIIGEIKEEQNARAKREYESEQQQRGQQIFSESDGLYSEL